MATGGIPAYVSNGDTQFFLLPATLGERREHNDFAVVARGRCELRRLPGAPPAPKQRGGQVRRMVIGPPRAPALGQHAASALQRAPHFADQVAFDPARDLEREQGSTAVAGQPIRSARLLLQHALELSFRQLVERSRVDVDIASADRQFRRLARQQHPVRSAALAEQKQWALLAVRDSRSRACHRPRRRAVGLGPLQRTVGAPACATAVRFAEQITVMSFGQQSQAAEYADRQL